MKNKLVAFLIMCALLLGSAAALQAGSWQDDFERLCGATETADTLSIEELNTLIVECDALLETIEKEGGKQKKIYLFRLKKCRNFFTYMVSLKEEKKKE